MENNLTFNNLQIALNSFIEDFIRTYKGLLIRDGKKASGNLISSLKPVSIEFSNNKMQGSIEIASYWKYVEYGRKIARDGIKPGNQYEEAMNIVWARWEKPISDAISKDLQEIVDLVTFK